MKRTQIQLDDETYAALRRRAYEEGRSMSALVRETLSQAFGAQGTRGKADVGDFGFVGVGRSRVRSDHPVSEHHDEALAAAFKEARP